MDVKVQRGVAIIPEKEKTIVVELKKAVNLNRAFIIPSGSIYGASYGVPGSWDARYVFLDEKYIEIKRAYPSSYVAEVAWQVVEVIPDVKSKKCSRRYGTNKKVGV